MNNIHNNNVVPKTLGPYSPSIVYDSLVFCSGQIGVDPITGTVVEGGIEAQTKQVLLNLTAVLEQAGSSIEKVLKTTVFLKDMNDFAVVNTLYGNFFNIKFPARSCIEVSRLPKDVLVEIELIAHI
ncbi:MAG: reactive intermediate/imine deaminase [Gracilibacter sp. BRH_c7a]|nr:MAG: reactive intermediate/imine deaminase [Gracilibacter sp. BRH_c7a]